MFAVDGEVLQQALLHSDDSYNSSFEETATSQTELESEARTTADRLDETWKRRSGGEGTRNGIIDELPAAIRLHLMSENEAKTLPTKPSSGFRSTQSTYRRRIPTNFRSTTPALSTINASASSLAERQGNDEHAIQTEITTPLELRHAMSEPDMSLSDNTPGLMPPPEFQEKFKFVVCSSRLLHDRPNFDGKRDSRLIENGLDLDVSDHQRPELSLAGLGIENVTMGVPEAAWQTGNHGDDGLRRRRVPSPIINNHNSLLPASFRRPSTASTASCSPATPLSPAYPSGNSGDSGWRFLAYMPFFCTLAPYTGSIALLLSSLLWILQIAGWIWLEVLAAMAIGLCGIVNIIAKKEVSREEMKRRKGIKRKTEKKDRQRDSAQRRRSPSPKASSAPHAHPDHRTHRPTTTDGDSKSQMLTIAPADPPQRRLEEKYETTQGDNESQSLPDLALKTLHAVVAEADQMDEVIAQALSIIRDSERSSPYIGISETPIKRLRTSLNDALTNLSIRFTDTYSALMPLVSVEELHTFEIMYRVDETETPFSPAATQFSPIRALPIGPPDVVTVSRRSDGNKQISQSTYSVTSTWDDEEISAALHLPQQQQGERYDISGDSALTKRNRARSSLSSQGKDYNPVLRNVQSFHGLSDSGRGLVTQDKFTPLPIRSPRLTQRQSSNLKRATSLKEKTSSGTIRPRREIANTDDSGDSGEVHKLQYSWRYPTTLQEETEASQSLAIPVDGRPPSTTGISPTLGSSHGDAAILQQQSIAIPMKPKGKLRELRLSQSGMGSFSQPGTSFPNSPQFGLSRTPEERLDSASYFATGRTSHGTPPMPLRRKRSSLQSLRYRNPDGTTVVASSPARHHRTRSSIDILPSNIDDFISNLPKAIVNGLQKQTRSARNTTSEASPLISERDSLIDGSRPPSRTARYSSSPAYPTNHQPRLQRAISFGHLTLTSLKATFLAVHLKRKRIACELLALDFASESTLKRGHAHMHQVALAKYWADVHILLDDLQVAMASVTEDVKNTLAVCKDNAIYYQPFLPGRPHESFAPRFSDESVMLEQIHILTRLLASAQNELVGLKVSVLQQDKQEIIHQWDQLRMDLAAMIRTWEKGRSVASRSSELAHTNGDSEITQSIPDFVRHWDIDEAPGLDNHEADTSNDVSISSPIVDEASSNAHLTAFDDASNHLLNSTSAAFLPPPGIEDVFEALLDRPAGNSSLVGPDGKKLSREERIQLVKVAREKASQGKSGINSSTEPNAPATTLRARNGEVVRELQSVITEMKERRTAGSSLVQE